MFSSPDSMLLNIWQHPIIFHNLSLSQVAFKIFLLPLVFNNFIMMGPCVAFNFSLTSSLLVFIRCRGFFSDILYIFSVPFYSSGTLTTSMLDYLILSTNY